MVGLGGAFGWLQPLTASWLPRGVGEPITRDSFASCPMRKIPLAISVDASDHKFCNVFYPVLTIAKWGLSPCNQPTTVIIRLIRIGMTTTLQFLENFLPRFL